jgi:hypothetical protein
MTTVDHAPGHDGGRPRCGGGTRAGGTCTQPAGWGTPHPGVGRCKLLDVVVGELGLEDVVWGQTKATADGVATYEAGTSVWVREWTVQRRHYLEVAKSCVAAGIAEQRIQLEQDKARMVAVAVSEGLDAIEATPDQREAFTRAMLARMRLVDPPAGEVTV